MVVVRAGEPVSTMVPFTTRFWRAEAAK